MHARGEDICWYYQEKEKVKFLPKSKAQYEHKKAEIALRNDVFAAKVALEKA